MEAEVKRKQNEHRARPPISGFYLVKHLELLLKERIENSELRMEKGREEELGIEKGERGNEDMSGELVFSIELTVRTEYRKERKRNQ